MMKWGRKKSSIGHVFPLSWISRFKKMSDSTERNAASTRRKEGENSASPRLPQRASWNEGQVHGGADDDLYWSLSFRKERCEGKKSGGVLKSVWYDDSDDGLEVRFIRLKSSRLRATKFEGREDSWNSKIQRRVLNDRKSRKIVRRILEENSPKDIFELEAAKIKDYQKSIASDLRKQHRSFSNSDLREIQEDCAMETLKLEQANALSEEEFFTSECLKLKNLKKNKCRGSWRRRNRKVVYTPRTAGGIECKIRALKDLKKAKMKTKKATKERAAKGKTIFDSFAVVKSSSDPQEDFKHSMVEMIMAKGIKQPQELEELLACYLTLNDDEYHDLIIKVFRQVRFELNPIHFDPAIQSKRCCNGEHL